MVVSAADTTSKAKAVSTAAAASPAIAPTSSAPAKPAGASTPHTDHALHGRALALVFFGLLLAMFISSLSETIASTALPTIVGDLTARGDAVGLHRLHPFHRRWSCPSTASWATLSAASGCSWRRSRCTPREGGVRPGHEHGDAHQRPPRLRPWGAAASSSYPRRRSPTWCRRASSAPTWASSAPCSPCRMCWARLWAAGSSR